MGREQPWPPKGFAMADKIVTLALTVSEARALLKAAETGVSVINALNRIPAMGLTESVVAKLRPRCRRDSLATVPGAIRVGRLGRRRIACDGSEE
jgi:hypothetical protein